MLPRRARMRNSVEFRETVRRGVRVGRPTLVLHAASTTANDVRVGLVVSKAIGNAVTRNQVKRRLRHLAVECLPTTPAGSRIVLRALPAAATSAVGLRRDLASAWRAGLDRLARRDGFA
ncbi:MAG TPA: ribonuclease P protein component [Microlunatus sp.]|nr:ribonuclease P protein component [Microlunatus sp.]